MRFIQWLKNIHSSGTTESAKRFYGAIGFICAIIGIFIFRHDLLDILLYTSAALLGLETIFNIFKKN